MLSADVNAPSMSLVTNRQFSLCALGILLIALSIHLIVWKTANSGFVGDEHRYLAQARHLAAGEPMYQNSVISNPPLYPIILASLMTLGVSDENLKLLNILAMVAATLLLLALLCQVCSQAWAVGLTSLFIFYPPLLMLGSQLMSEPVSCLLFMLALWILIDIRKARNPGLTLLGALAIVLALLALMKPMIGYALAAAVIGALCLAFVTRSHTARRSYWLWVAKSSLLSVILCAPFLIHVHGLTGSYFSWGTTGGEHLYWMSINDEDVWGSWVPENRTGEIEFIVNNGFAQEVSVAEKMSGPEANRFYSAFARQRIAEDPLGFMQNIIANAGRVLFNYPYSFRPQSLFTYAYLLPNALLYLSLALSALLLPITRQRQHLGLSCTIVFGLVYLGGNILVGSTGRQGVLLLGPLLVWLAWQGRALIDIGMLNPKARESSSAND